MKAKTAKVVSIAVSAVILAIILVLNIVCAAMSDVLDKWVVGYEDQSTGDTAAAREKGEALTQQIQGEGTVLVQNDDNLLPLDKSSVSKVNVFGWSATQWVCGGSGSGQVINASKDLLGALSDYGIEYNTELTEMYKRFKSGRDKSAALSSFNYEFSRLYEPNIDDKSYYTDSMLSNALDYSDTAIVVIGRVSGESNDSPKIQYKKNSSSNTIVEDRNRTYLEISTEEEALLSYVGANYDKVIVLINSTNVMELGFMKDINGLDSCLIVGTTGTTGAVTIPKIIFGEVSPSGKTADTYAYDLSTSSTYTDTGSGNESTHFYTDANVYPAISGVSHTNGSSPVPYQGAAYTDYREGIYVGYKWYETADTEGFWNSSYASNKWGVSGYDKVVQYPFGYGLSYTTFSWNITSVNHANNATLGKDDTIQIYVEVTNTGDRAGQDVVEIYYTPAYTAGGIEKSSVNLVAFSKTTNVLQPGDKQTLLLEFAVEDMKSYDYSDANNNGFSGYELEKGNYVVTLRTDSHTLADDKLVRDGNTAHNSATLTYRIAEDIKYDKDSATGNTVENRFTGSNTTDGVAIDGNSDGSADITYLSRGKFADTFPAEMDENRTMTAAIKALNLYTAEMANAWIDSSDEPITTGDKSKGDDLAITEKQDGKDVVKLTELGKKLAKDFNDGEWEDVLDRLTVAEMQNLVLHGYTQTAALDSVGKPKTRDLDGPNQLGSYASETGTVGFSSIVIAQSWNVELAYSMGLVIATDAARKSVAGWYGPGINLHRSPFGGRNFEYYSEDALLSGRMCAYAVKAAKNGGVFSYLKHLALYESESGRDGMYVWVTEQALRENYLKPFEIAIKEGGATGIMTSYGRIGAVWTGGSEALITEVVRNEWGFNGGILTDYSDHQQFMNGDQMLRAGGDLWMDGFNNNGSFKMETSSNSYMHALRNASKHVLYMWADALLTNEEYNEKIANGEIDGVAIVSSVPKLKFRWYIPVLIGIDVIAVGGCGAWITLSLLKKDGKESAE